MGRCFVLLIFVVVSCWAVAAGLFATALKNDEYSIDKYLEVGGDGHVLHVEQVVFEPFAHLVHRAGVAVFDLSP